MGKNTRAHRGHPVVPGRADHARREIAAVAARLIADDGLTDYAAAKRKAASSLGFGHSESLPDNEEIEAALREHLLLFQADTQPEALRVLRETALEVMQNLGTFAPVLVGPVVTGVANEFSPIALEIISDDPKAVDIALINARIAYDTELSRHYHAREPVPIYCFDYRDIEVEIAVFPSQAARAARHGKRAEHADIAALQALIEATKP